MKTSISPAKRILGLSTWSSRGIFLVAIILLQQGKPDLSLRWFIIRIFAEIVCAGALVATLVLELKSRGVLTATFALIAGVFFICLDLAPFLRVGTSWLVWLWLLGWGAAAVSGICAAWPQIRAVFNHLSSSYREISESSKV